MKGMTNRVGDVIFSRDFAVKNDIYLQCARQKRARGLFWCLSPQGFIHPIPKSRHQSSNHLEAPKTQLLPAERKTGAILFSARMKAAMTRAHTPRAKEQQYFKSTERHTRTKHEHNHSHTHK